MALTASFVANFQSFYDATQKATAKLTDLQTGAGRVEAALNRMGDAYSGRKTLSEATLAVRAIESIGGASTLTAKEQSRVNATVSEAITKYQALGKEAPAALYALQAQTAQLVYTVEPLPAHLQKVVAEAGQVGKLSGVWSDLTTQVKATALGFVSAQAIISGVSTAYHAFTEFLGSSIEAYAKQEAAVHKMTTALQTQGTATPAVISSFEAMATSFQNTTVYADELIIEMAALLTQVGNVMPSQMKGALKASTDLASGLGIDLRTATLLVGKAFEGETGTLKRYGIVIDEAKLKTQGVTAVMDAIQTKFGGQAAAEIDTYAGHLKQLGNAWDEVKEAVGRNIVSNPVFVAALRLATEESKKQAAAGADERAELAKRLQPLGMLGFAYLEIYDRAKAANIEVSNLNRAIANTPKPNLTPEFAPQFGQTLIDVKKYLDDEEEAQKKAAEAAKAHAAAIKNLMDAYSGTTAIKSANDALEALNNNLRAGKTVAMMTRDEQNRLNDVVGAAIRAYQSMGRVVPPQLRAIYDETFHLRTEMEKLSMIKINPVPQLGTNLQGTTLENQIPLIPRSSLISAIGLPTEIPGLDKLIIQTKEEAAETEKLRLATQRAKERFDAYAESLGTVSEALGLLAQMGGRTGQIFQGAQGIVASLQAANKANNEFGGSVGIASAMFNSNADTSQKWAAGIASGAQVASGAMEAWSSTTDDATKKSAALHGALAGAKAGAAFGPYGMAIGAVAGAVIGMVHEMSVGRREVEAFGKSFDTAAAGSGFDELRAKMLVLGAEGERLWIKLTQQTKKGDKAGAQAVEAEIKKALDLAADPTALNAMIRNAQVAGVKIPAALQPILENLIKTKQLTQENANLLLGLPEKGVPSFEAVSQAAERLGIKVESLGPKVQGIQFSEQAAQMVADFETVRDAGADMGVVFDQSTPKVQKLVDNAKKYGVELPLALKPFLQDMVEQGRLTDENGQKLEDLTGVKFAEPLSASVDRLISKLDELISKVTTGVGGALDNLGHKVVTPTIRPKYDPSNMPPPVADSANAGEGFAAGGVVLPFARGGRVPATFQAGGTVPTYRATGGPLGTLINFVPKGTDTVPAMLTPKEGIVSVPGMSILEPAGLDALNAGKPLPVRILQKLMGPGSAAAVAAITVLIAGATAARAAVATRTTGLVPPPTAQTTGPQSLSPTKDGRPTASMPIARFAEGGGTVPQTDERTPAPFLMGLGGTVPQTNDGTTAPFLMGMGGTVPKTDDSSDSAQPFLMGMGGTVPKVRGLLGRSSAPLVGSGATPADDRTTPKTTDSGVATLRAKAATALSVPPQGKFLDFGAGKPRPVTPVPTGAGGGGSTLVQTIQLVMPDGRILAEVVVPEIPGVVKRYGLA